MWTWIRDAYDKVIDAFVPDEDGCDIVHRINHYLLHTGVYEECACYEYDSDTEEET